MAEIWLIEDDENLAKLTQIALGKQGYQVIVFHEAHYAVELAKTQKPDLILMDVMLPDATGPEALKSIKKDPKFQSVPVIFLTALLSKEESALGLTVDNVNYRTLGKPYEIEWLMEMVERLLVYKDGK